MAKLCECGCGQPAPIATKDDSSTNRVKGQPMRFISGHNTPRTLPPAFAVDDRGYKTPCWAWQGRTIYSGYGIARGANGVMTTAHRVMYELHFGPVPEGMELDHLCRQRDCVNPDHLEPVTHLENMRRSRRARVRAA